jgi:hypothetical protein
MTETSGLNGSRDGACGLFIIFKRYRPGLHIHATSTRHVTNSQFLSARRRGEVRMFGFQAVFASASRIPRRTEG